MSAKCILLTAVVSSLLTACGSSSSQGTVDTGSTTSTTSSVATVKSDAMIGYENDSLVVSTADNTGDDLNSINIEGVDISLIPNGISSNGFYEEETSSSYKLVSGNKYNYLRFGIYTADDLNNESTGTDDDIFGVFAQGFATENMPTSGTAVYKGDAIAATENTIFWTKGVANINVDFGSAKSVSGTLSGWEDTAMDSINFDADIRGSRFSSIGSTMVNGQFYGADAAEIGGVITTSQDGEAVAAAFGATKQ